MSEFFSKDPVKQLDEIKECLYKRVDALTSTLAYITTWSSKRDYFAETLLEAELFQYKKLLDKMERS